MSVILANRYQLLNKIGQGGMGAVYRAIDRLTGDTIAVKQVSVQPSDLQFSSLGSVADPSVALALEFRTLASLRHPNIVSVLDFGFKSEDEPFFTMQLIENAQIITDYAKDVDDIERIHLLVELLHALTYLHRRNIVHRDLKPANVIITPSGMVKVMDFGLVLNQGQSMRVSQGNMVGTLAYMPPEMFSQGKASIRSDLYAVGLIAYEMFVGEYPFNRKSMTHLVRSILSEQPKTESLPSNIADVIDCLLSKDPSERYSSAQETILAFTKALDIPLEKESVSLRESYLHASEFVGRTTELDTLRKALENTLSGSGSAWLVSGESGVGKTRLLDEVRARALVRGAQVLIGQAVEGGGLTYQLWREPIRRLALLGKMSLMDASILKDIVSDIGDLLDQPVPDAPKLEGITGQQRLISTIVSQFYEMNRPTVILLEDLQWATESLEPLKRLIHMTADHPILVICSYRDDEVSDLPDQLIGAQTIPLKRLTQAETALLSASMLGEVGAHEQIVELLHRETEGNIFFIIEVIRTLAEDAGKMDDIGRMTLPQEVFGGSIRAVVTRRLNRVPAHAQPMLKRAAVLGRELDLLVLKELFSPTENIEDWLTLCADASVLDILDGQWRFTHDKLRKGIIEGLTPEELADYHRQVATAMESAYQHDIQGRALVLLEHWLLAGNHAKCLEHSQQALQQLIATGNFREATRIAHQALTMSPSAPIQADLLYQLGEAQYRLGLYSPAQSTLQQAHQLAFDIGNVQIHARSLLRLGWVVADLGDIGQAIQYYQQSLAIAQSANDTTTVARCLLNLGNSARVLGDMKEAKHHFEQSLLIAETNQDSYGVARALANLGWTQADMGDTAAARITYERCLKIATDYGNKTSIADLMGTLGRLASNQGDFEEAQKYLEQSNHINQEMGFVLGIASVHGNNGWLAYHQKQYEIAIDQYEKALAIYSRIGNRWGMVNNLLYLGLMHLKSGHDQAGISHLSRALTIANSISARLDTVHLIAGFAHYYGITNNLEKAITLFASVDDNPQVVHEFRHHYIQPLRTELEGKASKAVWHEAYTKGKQADLEQVIKNLMDTFSVDIETPLI